MNHSSGGCVVAGSPLADGRPIVCFSPEVDVAAGLVIGAIGIDTIRVARRRSELALASLPIVFAIHQLTEAFVWWGLQRRVPESVGHTATWIYLIIALWILPVMVPVAIIAIEPRTHRLRNLPFVVAGVVASAALLVATVRRPFVAGIEGHHIHYEVHPSYGNVITGLYVLATCGSMLVSQHRHVRYYGTANLVAVLVLTWLSQSGFVSLWCVWAGVTSFAINLHLRYDAPGRAVRPGKPGRPALGAT